MELTEQIFLVKPTFFINDSGKYNHSFLIQASNYLTSKFNNKNISQIKKLIQTDIKKSQDRLELVSSKLVQQEIIENPPNVKNPYIFLLLNDLRQPQHKPEMTQICSFFFQDVSKIRSASLPRHAQLQ